MLDKPLSKGMASWHAFLIGTCIRPALEATEVETKVVIIMCLLLIIVSIYLDCKE